MSVRSVNAKAVSPKSRFLAFYGIKQPVKNTAPQTSPTLVETKKETAVDSKVDLTSAIPTGKIANTSPEKSSASSAPSASVPSVVSKETQKDSANLEKLLRKARHSHIASIPLSFIPLVNLIPLAITRSRLKRGNALQEKIKASLEKNPQLKSTAPQSIQNIINSPSSLNDAKTWNTVGIVDNVASWLLTAGILGAVSAGIGLSKNNKEYKNAQFMNKWVQSQTPKV